MNKKTFSTDKINYEKIRMIIEDNCYSISGLARKLHIPPTKLKRALTKEGKHDYTSDVFVYIYIANLFEIDIEELIY